MNHVAILGVGLMGGSLGLGLKARGFSGKITAYARREETRDDVIARGIADEAFETPQDAVAEADIVVVCTPILKIPQVIQQALPSLKPGAIVTDVGSTKHQLETMLEHAAMEGLNFIGSHPICGSEQQGVEASKADLYQGALTVVCPPPVSSKDDIAKVTNFWMTLGSNVKVMTALEHDAIMAKTSHLPHVAASLLAMTVGQGDTSLLAPFCGSGFRDTTRIAEGSPDVWIDILKTNLTYVQSEMEALRGQADAVLEMLAMRDFDAIHKWLADARARRIELLSGDGE